MGGLLIKASGCDIIIVKYHSAECRDFKRSGALHCLSWNVYLPKSHVKT